jgi:hypothetical protein
MLKQSFRVYEIRLGNVPPAPWSASVSGAREGNGKRRVGEVFSRHSRAGGNPLSTIRSSLWLAAL